jgi:hypothetical protein
VKNYKIIVEDIGENAPDKFVLRKASISNGQKQTKNLTKAFPYQTTNENENEMHIKEVYLKKSAQELLAVLDDNSLFRLLNSNVTRKAHDNKFNVPFIEIEWDATSLEGEKERVAGVLADFVYGNKKVDLINPPKIVFPESVAASRSFEMYIDFLKTLGSVIHDTIGEHRMSCFIPEYFTMSQIERLIDFYVERYGEDSLLITDMNGKTFNSMSPKVFFATRTLRRKYHSDGFSIYAYNLKARKRSGVGVPSEDFLGLYSGLSYVGPSHKSIRMPREVLETLEATFGKLFYKSDFLYYPYSKESNDGPNQEFKEYVTENEIGESQINQAIKKFNFENTDFKIEAISKSPEEELNELERPIFEKELGQLIKARNKVMRNASLNDFD